MLGRHESLDVLWRVLFCARRVFERRKHIGFGKFYHERIRGVRQQVEDKTLELQCVRLVRFDQLALSINERNLLAGDVERQLALAPGDPP